MSSLLPGSLYREFLEIYAADKRDLDAAIAIVAVDIIFVMTFRIISPVLRMVDRSMKCYISQRLR